VLAAGNKRQNVPSNIKNINDTTNKFAGWMVELPRVDILYEIATKLINVPSMALNKSISRYKKYGVNKEIRLERRKKMHNSKKIYLPTRMYEVLTKLVESTATQEEHNTPKMTLMYL
jgi:hypothetical protein